MPSAFRTFWILFQFKKKLFFDEHDAELDIPSDIIMNYHERKISENLVKSIHRTTKWEDIGGLEPIIDELKETVFLPLHHRKLFGKSKLLKAPKGVLLHGPPGE